MFKDLNHTSFFPSHQAEALLLILLTQVAIGVTALLFQPQVLPQHKHTVGFHPQMFPSFVVFALQAAASVQDHGFDLS